MNLGILAKRASKLAGDNTPAILTAIGVTGAITTAYLTGKASFKAAEILAEAERNEAFPYLEGGVVRAKIEDLTFKEKAEFVWKLYVPAAASAALTITAIISANHIGTRRAAALASAYSLSEKAYDEYKEKVLAKIGEKKEQAVRDELAQEKVDKTPSTKQEVLIMSHEVLCFDAFTGRYFSSDMETLRRAVNDTNEQVINDTYAPLTDYYDRVGLARTDESDEIGWNTDELLKVDFSTTLSDDGRPCISIAFSARPVRNYSRLH